MYKRLELHNHTTESDASFTCRELIDFFLEDGVDGFALTDHNTISGHIKIRQIIEENHLPIAPIYGMEYTTYYGHILCLNLTEYVPWEDINLHRPELLFRAAKAKGALTGIAHPYSFGWPFAQGCRFVMKMTDYSCCDFIEIFNNLEPLHQVNEPALRLWENLVFSGNRLAATCGMDLHGAVSLHGHYATYIEGEPDGDISEELDAAIRGQRTWVSKGALLLPSILDGEMSFSVLQTGKPGYDPCPESYRILLRSLNGRVDCEPDEIISIKDYPSGTILIPQLFEGEPMLENLVCIAPPIRLN